MLNALLAHKEELLPFLPPSLVTELQRIPKRDISDFHSLISPTKWSEKIHFSWFSPLLKHFPKEMQPFFLGVLTSPQATGVKEQLSLDIERKETSHFLSPFLSNILKNKMVEEDLLSEQQLPYSALNLLLKLEKKQLIHLLDLLGIHDLATDLRQVIDRELLGKIHRVLNQEQLHFLQYCSKQPIKWVSPKLGLGTWDGTKAKLNHLLHHRGLIRLARAISQEDPSFKWYLLHRLDTGRAKIMIRGFQQKQDLALIPYFKSQVLHITKRWEQT